MCDADYTFGFSCRIKLRLACGMHSDADFAGARQGIGNVLIAQNVGRTVLVDDDGFHFRDFM